MKLKPELIKATLEDYPIIENMWRFYVYDMGRYCGLNKGWECPTDLSFAPDDLTHYFVDPTRNAFLVKVDGTLAGFVLLHKVGTTPDVDWNMGEFFILAKFQGKGIGEQIADQIFKKFPGIWEISIIPENTGALAFWRKVISHFTGGTYSEEIKHVDYDKNQAKHYILRFDTKAQLRPNEAIAIRNATKTDIAYMITGLNHITLAVKNIETSFAFYRDVLGFAPLCKWEGSAYFLVGDLEQPGCLWFCLDRDGHRSKTVCSTHYAFSVFAEDFKSLSERIIKSGAPLFKENTSPGESLYFLDLDGHKLEIHTGDWQDRIRSKKAHPGKWTNVEWFV